MFTLPSMWNLVISTVAFFIAAWYIRRYMDAQGITKGVTRSMFSFVLAYLVSWGAGEAADWTKAKISGPLPVVQKSSDLTQHLKFEINSKTCHRLSQQSIELRILT